MINHQDQGDATATYQSATIDQQIPAGSSAGFILHETASIRLYLAQNASLVPSLAPATARGEQWLNHLILLVEILYSYNLGITRLCPNGANNRQAKRVRVYLPG